MIVLAAGSYGLKVLGVTTFGAVVERRLGPLVSLLPAVFVLGTHRGDDL